MAGKGVAALHSFVSKCYASGTNQLSRYPHAKQPPIAAQLPELYQVEPRALVQAVKRNLDRFPEDFMFQLSSEEYENLKSQIVISSWGGARRATPYAFTEHGVAMLSSVLRSTRAVQMNILIIRAFVKLRDMLATHKDLATRMESWKPARRSTPR